MALEKSVLNIEIIKELLRNYYDLNIISMQKLCLGTANCYRVADAKHSYFLKEFQSGFTQEDLLREAKLVNFLTDNNFPTARLLLTIEGKVCFTYQGHLMCLQEYIQGKTYEDNNLPNHLLLEAAGLLGRLHTLLAEYDLPKDMAEDWVNAFSTEKGAAQYDGLLKALELTKDDPHYERIKSDLLYKKQLMYRIESYRSYYSGITYCATHGDFSVLQYICDDAHVKAIIDFSSARKLPVIWEIMRSYVQSSTECKNETEFDVAEFVQYVREYMRWASLSEKDLQAMPYVYLFQLARSKYGYKEYLIIKAENREELLQFAFWRTEMCRQIELKASEISEELMKLNK